MKKPAEEQVRETHARIARKGKVEQPPILTDEDEAALDAEWKDAHVVASSKESKRSPR